MTSTPMLTEAVSGGTLTDPCPLTLTVGMPAAPAIGVASSCAAASRAPPAPASTATNAKVAAAARTLCRPHVLVWSITSLLSLAVPDAPAARWPPVER